MTQFQHRFPEKRASKIDRLGVVALIALLALVFFGPLVALALTF